jgi:hypothetical protein
MKFHWPEKLFMFFVVAALTLPQSATAQPSQEWVARYFGSSYGAVVALAVDGSGNVCVTGYANKYDTDYDYITIKYDSNGNQLWLARYDGPANSNDRPADIAVDASGNIYVTGLSVGIGSWGDYATVKYDPDGNQLWVARYNGPEPPPLYWRPRYDHAKALAVDANGNVYVTGGSLARYALSDYDYEYTTVKYDANGNQVWLERYNGAGNLDPLNGVEDYFDCAYDIAVGPAGNVYVTGESTGSGTGRDYITIKYAPSGNQLWVSRYDWPDGDPRYRKDYATALALDNSGNVYVTGTSGADHDLATVKYDPDGNQLWVARHHRGGLGTLGTGNVIAIDADGNAYVAGCTAGDEDYLTIKYDAGGNELWVQTYDGPGVYDGAGNYGKDYASALVLDGMGNVYVAGLSEGAVTSNDYAVVKYDAEGHEQWVLRYDGPTTRDDTAVALCLDGENNIYVTGTSAGPATNDYATVKYSEKDLLITDISPTVGKCREVVTVSGNHFEDSQDAIVGSSGALGACRVVRISGPSDTYTAYAYGGWSDTQFTFRFGDLFIDNDSDFLRDPTEPFLRQCQNMPLGTYSVQILTVDYEDVDASANYTEGDAVYQVKARDTADFTLEQAPAVYLIEPSSVQRSHYCPDGSLVNGMIKIYGWGFGDEQGNGKVYIGTGCMYFNTLDALNNGVPIPAFDKTCNGGGKILNRLTWSNLMIKAAVDVPDGARGNQLYVWVVKDGKATSDAYGYPGVFILNNSICP